MTEINEYQEGFIVDSDNKAEWAICKIKEEQNELKRLEQVIDYQIQEYQLKKEQLRKKTEGKTENLKNLLLNYFENVPKKATKTQEKYTLPSGELIRKFSTPKFEKDDKKLVLWLEANNRNDLVQTTKSPDWATLKKSVTVQGNKVIDENGEIVEGITVTESPETFEIKF